MSRTYRHRKVKKTGDMKTLACLKHDRYREKYLRRTGRKTCIKGMKYNIESGSFVPFDYIRDEYFYELSKDPIWVDLGFDTYHDYVEHYKTKLHRDGSWEICSYSSAPHWYVNILNRRDRMKVKEAIHRGLKYDEDYEVEDIPYKKEAGYYW